MINLSNADFLQNSVNNAYSELSQPLQSLAAGSQLNGPSENPSDYFLSQSLLSQLNGTQQADANVQEGMDMLQTASGGLSNALGSLQTQNSIQQVSSQQASLGAAQAGLGSMAASLENSAVNTASALSQVSDADFASESAGLASARGKPKASIYALSTANQEKGQILNLLA